MKTFKETLNQVLAESSFEDQKKDLLQCVELLKKEGAKVTRDSLNNTFDVVFAKRFELTLELKSNGKQWIKLWLGNNNFKGWIPTTFVGFFKENLQHFVDWSNSNDPKRSKGDQRAPAFLYKVK